MEQYRKQMPEIVLGGSFFQPNYHMVSADPSSADRWESVVGRSGHTWLYQPEGSVVWVEGGPGSQGCGGRTIPFVLTDGSTLELKGPWCSNSDAFFKDCGIDVRANHFTWGCIGTERLYDENTRRSGIGNILWFDPEPVKGFFDRVDLIAWKMHLENPDLKLQVYWESRGGSSLGPVHEPYRLRVARKEEAAMLLEELLTPR
ncbi:hypothetical protein EVB71_025 [Rhizobium phage RHph_Y55]|nr:hypothetical protein EVB71_025 [Rhizobium phage RHph_Y55]